MGKWYLFNVYTFCKSLYVINVGSPYGLHTCGPHMVYMGSHMYFIFIWSNVIGWVCTDQWIRSLITFMIGIPNLNQNRDCDCPNDIIIWLLSDSQSLSNGDELFGSIGERQNTFALRNIVSIWRKGNGKVRWR